jgi:hypothetical protein
MNPINVLIANNIKRVGVLNNDCAVAYSVILYKQYLCLF